MRMSIAATSIAIGLSAVVLIGTGTVALADKAENIHACEARSSGDLRIAAHCRGNERAITWAKQGPDGPPGVAPGFIHGGHLNLPAGHFLVTWGVSDTVSKGPATPYGTYDVTTDCTLSSPGMNWGYLTVQGAMVPASTTKGQSGTFSYYQYSTSPSHTDVVRTSSALQLTDDCTNSVVDNDGNPQAVTDTLVPFITAVQVSSVSD
jgi:hypothetical protein